MLIVLLFFLLIITPVSLRIDWDRKLTISLRVWGIHRAIPAASSGSGGGSSAHRQLAKLFRIILRTERSRRFLHRHVKIIRLQALLCLGLSDAARTAVLTGFLQQLTYLLPDKADVRVQPDFLAPTRLKLRCILFFHLGTIFITAAIALAAHLPRTCRRPRPRPKEA